MSDTENGSADARLAGVLAVAGVFGALAFLWVDGSLLFRAGNAALGATLSTAAGILGLHVLE
ncbi:hypothetical protein [Haloarchaeobius sp. HRN-SO-5]|uniref:hypothetical protein n=1 Tax=Haloarchaeobius sp. HRN-SO-5 TaxID=3446118 RepID=UPI003EBC2F4C